LVAVDPHKEDGVLGFAEAVTVRGDVTEAPSLGPETVNGKSLDSPVVFMSQ